MKGNELHLVYFFSYLMYLDMNNFFGQAMQKKLLVDGFKWRKDLLRFNEEFIQRIQTKTLKWNTYLKSMLIIP